MVFSLWGKKRRVRQPECVDHLSLEDVVDAKLRHFFAQLGQLEATGLRKIVIAQVERPLLRLTLEWARGNQLKGARLLGINRNTLRRRMRELGIKK